MKNKINNKNRTNFSLYVNNRKINLTSVKNFFGSKRGALLKRKKYYRKQYGALIKKVYFSRHTKAKPKPLVLIISGLIIGFINGFWGGGGGMVCVPTLAQIFKLPQKHAHATAILIILPLSVVSFCVYWWSGSVNFNNAGWVVLFFAAGAGLGAMLLKRANNLFLQFAFSLIIIWGGIRLVF